MRTGPHLFPVLVVLSCVVPGALSQSVLSQISFGGSGTDSIRRVATDASGNIYVVGTTYSADLPVLNAFQPANQGTQVVYSPDAGVTWNALQSPLAPGPGSYPNLRIAVDPANAATVYLTNGPTLCKSQDAGNSFRCATLGFLPSAGSVTQLLVDPKKSSRLYLTALAPGNVFLSSDGGETWSPAGQGLPQTGLPYILTTDPFHPGALFVWTGVSGFVSRDGAATWSPSSLPYLPGVTSGESFFGFFFDAVTPDVIYGPGFAGTPGSGGGFTIQKSTDGGRTWTQLKLPFSITSFIGPDPKFAGTLYALGSRTDAPGAASLWRSSDGGATWSSTPVPDGLFGPVVFDPDNPQIVLAGAYTPRPAVSPATLRSADGGRTWSPVAQRILLPAFAPSKPGTLYAAATPTSDAFLAKFLPDGQTLAFATYFGGSANETGDVIALDPSGNIWIGGSTFSNDLPVTPGAFQSSLRGLGNGFVAKFSNDGQLLASSYIGGSAADTVSSLAVGPDGKIWVGGRWTSPDFPFTTKALVPPSPVSYLVELDWMAQSLLIAMPLDGWLDTNGNAIAVDTTGSVVVAGSTSDPNFPSTVAPLPSLVPSTSAAPRAFVLKLDPSGGVVYSTAFGGSKAAPLTGKGIGIPSVGNLENYGVAAVVDGSGNVYIAGYTSATDFPTTTGAFQTTLQDACPYPAFEINTGLIGVISSFYMDDAFVVKLSPDGMTALYSTLIGGQCFDHLVGLAIDASGRAVVTGETDSFDFAQAFPLAGAPALMQYASFVSVLNPDGSGLDFSTYLYAGAAPAIAVALDGSLVVAGSAGAGAQTSAVSGAYIAPLASPLSHGLLTTLMPPQSASAVNLAEVRNAFSLQPGPVAPGELVALTLPGFAPDQPADLGLMPQQPLTTTLAGVTVLFDGHPAYLTAATAGKVVALVPQAIARQTTTAIQVTAATGVSNVLTLNVAATAVGLLSLDGSGAGAAYARNSDGSLNGPSNPAAIGSPVTIYFTGGGVTNPPQAEGTPPAGEGAIPVASLPIYPVGGTISAAVGFVPGVFAYTFPVPASPSNVAGSFEVSTLTNYYQSQFLRIFVK